MEGYIMTVNNRKDLDTIQGTPQHEQFIEQLRQSVYRWVWDKDAQEWQLNESLSLVEMFGYTKSDIKPVKPVKPDYMPSDNEIHDRIAELQQKLRDTDFKILADYRERSGMTDADYDEIVNQRKSWYDEIRQLEQTL